jgi:hypothetical protein
MHRLPRLLICAAASGLLAAGPASAAKRISTDPYTNPDSQHATQVEPDTFAFGATVVSAFQSGRFFDGGASNVGWATSQDRGKTWVKGFLPSTTVNSTPAGPYERLSDPAVAYDAKHKVWLVSTLGFSDGAGKAVLASRSTDGGLTWGAPVAVSTTTGFYDKNWIACDNTPTSPHHGNCYTVWDDVNLGDRLLNSTSSDGGLTWGAKKANADNGTGLGGQPVVQPGGKVIVPALSAFADRIIAYNSANGGDTWSATTTIATISEHSVAGDLRTLPLPSAEVDGAGKVYVVWQDCRFRAGCASNDIVLSTSTNGTSWTSPVRIPIDPVSSGVDHFIPGLAVDRNSAGNTARLALTYYFYPDASCTQSTCELMVGFVSSMDGGASWSEPLTLAGPMRLTDLASTSQGVMVGDYISTSFSGSRAVPAFAVGKPKSGNVFDEATYTSKLKVNAQQRRPLRVADDPVRALQGDAAARRHPVVTW